MVIIITTKILYTCELAGSDFAVSPTTTTKTHSSAQRPGGGRRDTTTIIDNFARVRAGSAVGA